MASRKALLITAAAMAVVVLPPTAFANNHLVGDLEGWKLGVDYTLWASNNDPIPVGDALEFRYKTGEHTVVRVEAEDAYTNCDVNDNIGYWDDGEHTVVQLEQVGKYYFICGTWDYCKRGMKFAISATDGSSAAPGTSGNDKRGMKFVISATDG